MHNSWENVCNFACREACIPSALKSLSPIDLSDGRGPGKAGQNCCNRATLLLAVVCWPLKMMLRTPATLLLATIWSAPVQSAGDTDRWQPVISNLRACVRSNAPTAQIAGLRTMSEAVDFLYRQCSASLLSDIAKADACRSRCPRPLSSGHPRRMVCV